MRGIHALSYIGLRFAYPFGMRHRLTALALLVGACSAETTSPGGGPNPNPNPNPEPTPIAPQPLPNPQALPSVLPERLAIRASTAGHVIITGAVDGTTQSRRLRILDIAERSGLVSCDVRADGSFEVELPGHETDRFLFDPIGEYERHGLLTLLDGNAGHLTPTRDCLTLPHAFELVRVNDADRSIEVLVSNKCGAPVTVKAVALGTNEGAMPVTIGSGDNGSVTVNLAGALTSSLAVVLHDEQDKPRLAALFEPAVP